MTAAEVAEAATTAVARERLAEDPAGAAVVVDLRSDPATPAPAALADALAALPRVFVAITGADDLPQAGTLAAATDVVVVDDAAAGEVAARVAEAPVAAASLALLLRDTEHRSVSAGLVAESATYSLLQAGPEHQGWLRSRTRKERPPEAESAVRVDRDGDHLLLTLTRPHVRNAFDARTREELLAALMVADADPTIAQVVLRGDGPTFCSGGDLDEFGTLSDPASAHVLRVARSAGRAIAALAPRVTVHVHGACVGAGVELPAFASTVVADAGTSFRLPEVGMGLVPGAGGTVSIPRRIGRQRTGWMALTGRAIDAATALAWGLVDDVRPPQDAGAP